MLNQFMTASVNSRGKVKERLDAVQKDLLGFATKGGVGEIARQIDWRSEAAALVRQAVSDTFALTDPTPMFVERREGKFGDTYEFEKLIPTARVVEYSPQSQPQAFTPRKAKYAIKTSSYELSYGIPLQKVINGQFTLAEIIDMVGKAKARHYSSLCLGAINIACAVGASDIQGRPLRTMTAYVDVGKEDIDSALRRVRSIVGDNGISIVGTSYTLDPLHEYGATTEVAQEELRQRGTTGVYRGAKLVTLTDTYNEYYKQYATLNGVDLSKLLFITAGQAGAVMLERDYTILDWEELNQREAQWSMGERFDHGVLVHSPSRYHVIEMGNTAVPNG